MGRTQPTWIKGRWMKKFEEPLELVFGLFLLMWTQCNPPEYNSLQPTTHLPTFFLTHVQ